MSLFTNSGVAIITPFKNDGIDYDKLNELLEWHIEKKTDAVIICGTTGESATLSANEKKAVIKFTVDSVKHRIPVIAGTGGNNTAAVIELSRYAESVGSDGLLIVTPYYNKTTQSGLIAHYTKIADSVGIPIIMYNVPSRTGLNMTAETCIELSEHRNILAIKEASGNIGQIAKIAKDCDQNFDIYSGNDDQIVPIMALGGIGVISVVANILPTETHDICEYYSKGRVNEAKELQLKMLDVINALFIEVNPIPVKEAMNLLGMKVGECRLPLTAMSEKNRQILQDKMKTYGLL